MLEKALFKCISTDIHLTKQPGTHGDVSSSPSPPGTCNTYPANAQESSGYFRRSFVHRKGLI
jgi:hypothetical protein